VQARPARGLALEDGELMPEREDLRLEVEAGPKSGPEAGDQGNERRGPAGRERYQASGRIRNDDKTFGVFGKDTRDSGRSRESVAP
jgi:hypothetical protein